MKYPKASPTGGSLIRQTIKTLRELDVELPLQGRVVVACSGGADSMAMVHLLNHLGRKVVRLAQLEVLYLNHHWSTFEETRLTSLKLIRQYCERHQLKLYEIDLPSPLDTDTYPPGCSREEVARRLRREQFQKFLDQDCWLITAHHADDLAETLLWRQFTGNAAREAGGILGRQGKMIRPFLRSRKSTLVSFLKEEKISYYEDPFNQDLSFLRVQVRRELLPMVEKIFPRAVEHLIEGALEHQKAQILDQNSTQAIESDKELSDSRAPGNILGVLGIQARQSHWKALRELETAQNRPIGQRQGQSLDLPGGWRMTRLPGPSQRWMLEQKQSALTIKE